MTDSVQHFTYRLQEPGDAAAIARLWSRETPWGAPKPELVRWYNANPTEGSYLVVAVDGHGEIVGQLVMLSTRVSVQGRDVAAMHVFAPILSRAAREAVRVTNDNEHPFSQMFAFAIAEARRRQVALVYSMPGARWMGFFARVPGLQLTKFPLWSLPLPLLQFLPIDDEYRVSRLMSFDQRVDSLWETASALPGCRAIRNAQLLQWRLSGPLYDVTAVERHGELVGLVAAKEKDGQWTVCDVLSRDTGPSLQATLAAACNAGHTQSLLPNRTSPLTKISLLTTEAHEPVAAALGFARDAYDYLLSVQLLDQSLAADDIAPHRWYVTDNE